MGKHIPSPPADLTRTLYDSEAFVVLLLQPDIGDAASDAGVAAGHAHRALSRCGFEIVDKRVGRHVYLDGSWAELFQRQIDAWQDKTPTSEELEDTLEHYTALSGGHIRLH